MNSGMLRINLSSLLFSLSLALDIAENRNYEHSRRTAYVAYNIAKHLGLEEEMANKVFYGALIHDIGMTGQLSSYGIRDIHYDHQLMVDHCFLGSKIAESLPVLDGLPEMILYHHEEWNGKGIYGLKGNETPLTAQIIHIADYFDIDYNNILNNKLSKEDIEAWISKRRGREFNPILADALLKISQKDKFWLDLRFHNLHQLLNVIMPNEEITINIDQLKEIANTFALLIDSKSKFTHMHSQGVAQISRRMAEYLNYDEIKTKKIEIAGLLHDLGKIVVPNHILEKPTQLTKEEFEIIKSHPYYTKLILQQINGLEDIAQWAGNHHEKLNGNGYPEKLNHNCVFEEDQILAVADIYQALTEDRPYRKGLTHGQAMDILTSMGEQESLSTKMVETLGNAIEQYS